MSAMPAPRFSATVEGGRLVIDAAVDLPEGTRVELIAATPDDAAQAASEGGADLLHMDAAWFHAFMEHSPVTAFIKDADGRLLYINRRFMDAFSFGGKDWRGKLDFELWPEETAKALRENDLAILESGVAQAVEETVTHEDGEHTWVTVKFRFRDDGGRVYLAGMGIDRTEQQRLEAMVAQASRLESIGQLAGSVAHDFNNLLTIVMCNCELASNMTNDAMLGEFLSEIGNAASIGSRLTQQLLGLAREQIFEPKDLDVAVQLDALMPTLRRLASDNVEVHVEQSSGPLFIRFDTTQFEQTLLNLLANACDAMSDGGELYVSARALVLHDELPVHNGSLAPGEYVAVGVRDTGPGIAPEVLPNIFDAFYTTKPRGHGTGLGLATVRSVAAQNGAAMSVESEPGRGSVFTLIAPRVAVPVDSASPAPSLPRSSSGGGETILFVDDDPQLRRASRRILMEHGYEVLIADSGEHAMELVSNMDLQIDMLVTDIVMLGVGGVEIANRVSSLRPAVPILFVSGYADHQLDERGLREKREWLLRKPFMPTELVDRIRGVLDGRE